MASLNKVQIIGNLGRDPELRSFPNGGQIASFSVATTERWKDKQTGEQKELTEWHNVVLNGRNAELAGQYLKKGSSVYIEGRLRTRKWQDQSGQDRYTTEVRGDHMQFLGGRDGGQQAHPQQRSAPAPAPAPRQAPAQQQLYAQDFPDDDIPF